MLCPHNSIDLVFWTLVASVVSLSLGLTSSGQNWPHKLTILMVTDNWNVHSAGSRVKVNIVIASINMPRPVRTGYSLHSVTSLVLNKPFLTYRVKVVAVDGDTKPRVSP